LNELIRKERWFLGVVWDRMISGFWNEGVMGYDDGYEVMVDEIYR